MPGEGRDPGRCFVVLGMDGRRMRGAEGRTWFGAQDAPDARAVALPGSLAVLLSGGWLMQDSGLEIGEAWWLGSGIGIWAVAFLGSTMLRGPQLARAVAVAAEVGPEDEDVRWRIRQVRLIARGELMLLCVALAVMVLTPS